MKYLVTWNCGYGENWEVVDVETQEEAYQAARDYWKEDVESNADYNAKPLTEELKIDYGIEEEE